MYVFLSQTKSVAKRIQVFKATPEDASSAVQEAIKAGYRHVDSAVYYENQSAVAEALLKAGVPRDQLFFTTKVHPYSTSYDGAKEQVTKTLQEIGRLEYVDLMLIHAPYGGSEKRLGAWKALVEAVQEGKIRSIGVSNYGVQVNDRCISVATHLADSVTASRRARAVHQRDGCEARERKRRRAERQPD